MAARYPKARGRHVPGQKNELEEAWGNELESRRQRGEVAWFEFEPFKILLGPKTTYTPDYCVQLADGTMQLHECKGFWHEDAWAKFKIAVGKLPTFTWIIVTRPKKREPFVVEEYAA